MTFHPIRLLLLILVPFSSYSQDSIITKTDSSHYSKILEAGHQLFPYNKKRVRLVAAGNIIGYGAVTIGFNSAWYSQYPRSRFHFFDDNAEWLQVDKAGHAYGAYIQSSSSYEMWRWSGLSRKQRIWIGGLSGIAYQSIIETLDGFSAEYGWSWGDYGANVFGSGLFIAQELAWDDQRIKLKFSFHKKDYGAPDLNARADVIFGKTEKERFFKDYNAATDWMSFNIKSFLPKTNLPRWLSVAVGYGAEGMFGARSNIAKDKNGNVIFDRSDIRRYRQWYIAPDIDLNKIRTKSKALHIILSWLNSFKFPAPSLEFSKGKVRGHWFYF
jgi:hypothetical protein